MHRYYVAELAEWLARGGPLVLAGEEARHLVRVKRARPGEEVLLFDGRGAECWARLERVESGRAVLCVLERPSPRLQAPLRLRVALAPPERPRLLWAVEKLTELGVQAVSLLQSERGQERAGSLDRLRRRALEAAKQCGVLVPPAIQGPLRLQDALGAGAGWRCVVLDARAELALVQALGVLERGAGVVLAVGPAGGFTEAELAAARAAGAVCARLGPTVLRTETAAVAAAAVAVALAGAAGRSERREAAGPDEATGGA
ncbi:MAG: ribosomal RNA small subunit methyltransferase E [Planctomycetota bacterium]|nr:MAG: ribosomal RNA small subunit methyltransferase E [Planctomycetota bacterium]